MPRSLVPMIPRPFLALLSLIAASTACTHAWSQPAAAQQVAADDSLTKLLERNIDLATWTPSLEPPTLACPSGATLSRNIDAQGYELFCARGDQKDGDYRSFNRKERREIRASYRAGKLHGWHIEIALFPTLSRNGSYQSVLIPSQLDLDLATWLPTATPELSCPRGTTLHRAKGYVDCIRPDGTQHGPMISGAGTGFEYRSLYEDGQKMNGDIVIDDHRTAFETLYEDGHIVRRLEWTSSRLVQFETHKGESVTTVRWHKDGKPASIVSTEGGKAHGEWQKWHPNGTLAERISYKNGEEYGTGQRWDEKGQVIETRRLEHGTGVVESVQPGRDNERTRCEMKNGEKHGRCDTVSKTGMPLERRLFDKGKLLSHEMWWENGRKRIEYKVVGEGYESVNYSSDGKKERQSSCDGKDCIETTWDNTGKASTVRKSQHGGLALPDLSPLEQIPGLR